MKTRALILAACLVFQSGCFQEGTNEPLPLSENTKTILQLFKPALAVRGINCMLCHAQVRSSIITDFGYGDAQFFVGSKPGTIYGESSVRTDSKPLTLPWYGNYYGTFQLADHINGTLVVPSVTITDSAFLNSLPSWNQPSISLAQLMQLDLGDGYYGNAPRSGRGAISDVITPSTGKPKVAEIDQIYIGAPKESEILGLTHTLSGVSTGWEPIGENAFISGLVVQAGNGGNYVTHSGSSITCYGDIVVKGTLFLNDVTVNTDDLGCRLLVTQSVFLQGRVQYAQMNGTQNLQISSARAILMGFNPTTLTTRLRAWYPDAQPLTRGSGTNTQKNNLILAEAQVIGAAQLHDSTEDSSCPTAMVTYTAQNGESQSTLRQCSIHFQRLLLNAPNVQSRYVGKFSGVTIAEIALFAPGALEFEYDPVFDTAPILPPLTPVLEGSCVSNPFCYGGPIGI